ncbi:MAG TPA: DUF1801 domain-containing protein [Devosia sp.]|nr:DUF1801 domain-containing protein [Devosia sp.]
MTPSDQIDQLIAGLGDWRGAMLAQQRQTFLAADPGVFEEWKWMGSPVWECDGMIAVANAHKGKVKVTFSHGASLPDPDRLFNAGLEGKVWRAIDLFEGDQLDVPALTALVRAAIIFNRGKLKTKASAGPRARTSKKPDAVA